MEAAAFDVADGRFSLGSLYGICRALELPDGSGQPLLVQCITLPILEMNRTFQRPFHSGPTAPLAGGGCGGSTLGQTMPPITQRLDSLGGPCFDAVHLEVLDYSGHLRLGGIMFI
jgi:hypothetical protein